MSDYSKWDKLYQSYPLDELGWELGKPRPLLVEYLNNGLIPKGFALDLCCGAATNTIYLAKSGLDVLGIDISRTALAIAKEKACQANVNIDFLNESFVDVSFRANVFDFIFDMGCFHHVHTSERGKFILGIERVLKKGGTYMLTAFSHDNGHAWNHFTEQQLVELFTERFEIKELKHYPSLEGDGVIRIFYTLLMKKRH